MKRRCSAESTLSIHDVFVFWWRSFLIGVRSGSAILSVHRGTASREGERFHDTLVPQLADLVDLVQRMDLDTDVATDTVADPSITD